MERAQRTTAAVAPLQEGMARLVDGFEEDHRQLECRRGQASRTP